MNPVLFIVFMDSQNLYWSKEFTACRSIRMCLRQCADNVATMTGNQNRFGTNHKNVVRCTSRKQYDNK